MAKPGAMGAAILLAALGPTSGCDRTPERAGHTTQPASPDRAAKAYLARLSAGDPEACFGTATLRTADFAAKGSTIATGTVPTRVLVAIDASGSMAGQVSGRRKLDLAKEAADAFLDGLPARVEAGLLVFGQAGNNAASGRAMSCRAVDLAVPLSRDRAALAQAVATIRPVGWTPLAAALRRAEALLGAGQQAGAAVIYVVSDGQETCGGDPVAAARAINRGPTRAVVNIIGFAVPTSEAAALRAVASAGGGSFVNSDTDREMDETMARIREGNRQTRNQIAQSDATTRNNISVSDVATKARICTSDIITRENIAIGDDLTRKRIAGRDVAVEERAERIMRARHEALETRVDAFVRRLEAGRDRTNEAVEGAAARAR